MSKPDILRLTCTQETYEKYKKKKSQCASETVVALSQQDETVHENMCYYVMDKDEDRIDRLSHLLQRCFGSYHDQDSVGIRFKKEMTEKAVDMSNISRVLGFVPGIYDKAREDVLENSEDVVSHSSIMSHCPMVVSQIPVSSITTMIHNAFILDCVLSSRTKYRGIRKRVTHVSSSVFEDYVVKIRTTR